MYDYFNLIIHLKLLIIFYCLSARALVTRFISNSPAVIQLHSSFIRSCLLILLPSDNKTSQSYLPLLIKRYDQVLRQNGFWITIAQQYHNTSIAIPVLYSIVSNIKYELFKQTIISEDEHSSHFTTEYISGIFAEVFLQFPTSSYHIPITPLYSIDFLPQIPFIQDNLQFQPNIRLVDRLLYTGLVSHLSLVLSFLVLQPLDIYIYTLYT